MGYLMDDLFSREDGWTGSGSPGGARQTDHWIRNLLPLRSLRFTLEFLEETPARRWMEPVLTAFLRSLIGSPADFDQLMTVSIDSLPGGGTWARGTRMAARVTALPGSQALLARVMERVSQLPAGVLRCDPLLPLRDNVRCVDIVDGFSGQSATEADALRAWGEPELRAGVEHLRSSSRLTLRFTSPMRILLPKEVRGDTKGVECYCRTAEQLTGELLLARMYDTLTALSRRRGDLAPHRSGSLVCPGTVREARWEEHGYTDRERGINPMGGLICTFEVTNPACLDDEALCVLLMASHLGIGQRRSFGWGRFQVETDEPPVSVGRANALGTLLVVAGAPSRLSLNSGRIRIEQGKRATLSAPLDTLAAVTVLGPHQLSTQLLGALADAAIPLALATGNGRLRGVLCNGQPGHEGAGLWLRQVACFSDESRSLPAARALVSARLRHQREVLRTRLTQPDGNADLDAFDQLVRAASRAKDLAVLNGIEGLGARHYFRGLASLVPQELNFAGRNRRPPRDPFNVLLSLGYTVLHSHVDTVIRINGLYPWRGFYHQPHGLHPALASDLMEPFRHIVERVALNAVRRGGIGPSDFETEEGKCRIRPEARRRYLAMLSERLLAPVRARGDIEAMGLHDHLNVQTRNLIAWVRGEAAEFEPFRLR